MEESFLTRSRRSYVYENNSRDSGGKRRIIFIIGGIIILIALVVTAIVATGGEGEIEENITPTPTESFEEPSPTEEITLTPENEDTTPTPTSKTTPTPTKGASSSTVDRSGLSIAVQNGGGVAGAATKAKDTLEDLGYTVSSTGNADNFDYETTTIRVKAAKKQYLDQLKKDLSASYTIGSASADLTSGSADAIVIIGKK